MNTKVCERCDREMRMVPAGTSKKTGKPYSAFWSCDARNGGCGHTMRAEGEEGGAAPVQTFGGAPAAVSADRIAKLEEKIDQLIEMVRGLQER